MGIKRMIKKYRERSIVRTVLDFKVSTLVIFVYISNLFYSCSQADIDLVEKSYGNNCHNKVEQLTTIDLS